VDIDGLRLWIAGTNSWFVAPSGPGGECVLIDAPPDPGAIIDRLLERNLRLVALLATHGHADHVGGVAEVVGAQDRDVPVHLHDADRHLLLDPIANGGTLGQILAAEDLDLEPPELVYGLDDGQRVSGAGMTFTALHTPGHTKGSVCFLLEIEGAAPVLFSGDHLFAGSIGRTDLPGGSIDELMASMTEKILPLDDEVAVLPGHGPTTTVGDERRTNPFIAQLLAR
jgi:glyoxylase-like metal-dependent hydrolase (beta-lactamase superfamily II)